MAQRTPDDYSAVQSGSRSLRISTLLFVLALASLLVAASAFVLEFDPYDSVVGHDISLTLDCPSPAPISCYVQPTPTPIISVSPTAGPTIEPSMAQAQAASAILADMLPRISFPTPTAPPNSPTAWTTYTVKSGDSLFSIAAQMGIPVSELVEVNQLSADRIYVGTILLVPDTVLTPESPTLASVETATLTPTPFPTPTETASATPTATSPAMSTPTVTAATIPISIGRFAMGYPLTMTVGGSQTVYVEIATSGAGAPGVWVGGGDTIGTGLARKVRVAIGEPDVLTEIVREVRLYPNMRAVLDAPAFAVRQSGTGAAEMPDWRSLQDGSALWLWNISATKEGKQTITVQVFGRQSPADAPEDVLFEVQPVGVLAEPVYIALLKSEVLPNVVSPAALLLSVIVATGGLFLRRRERLERPVKGLPGVQLKQLHSGLLSAFSTKDSLEQMVRIRLDQNLAVISTGDNLGDITYDLIRWAESNGQIEWLLEGALAENARNADLQQLARQWNRATSSSSNNQ